MPKWPALIDFESEDDAIGWSTDTGLTQCGAYGKRIAGRDDDRTAIYCADLAFPTPQATSLAASGPARTA